MSVLLDVSVCALVFVCACLCLRDAGKTLSTYAMSVLDPLPARPKSGHKMTYDEKTVYHERSGPRLSLLNEFKIAYGTL